MLTCDEPSLRAVGMTLGGVKNNMDGLKKGVESKIDSMEASMESNMDDMEVKIDEKMENMKNDLKLDMGGLTKLIKQMFPDG